MGSLMHSVTLRDVIKDRTADENVEMEADYNV